MFSVRNPGKANVLCIIVKDKDAFPRHQGHIFLFVCYSLIWMNARCQALAKTEANALMSQGDTFVFVPMDQMVNRVAKIDFNQI